MRHTRPIKPAQFKSRQFKPAQFKPAQLAAAALLAVSAIAPSIGAASAQEIPGDTDIPPASSTRFSCELADGEYTIMYSPESQPDTLYAWAAPGDMGGGWSADRRCAEISRRLELYRPDGLLELRTDIENGYDTVCATTEASSECRIVFTVPQGQDPLQTRDRVFENLAIANQGQETTAVNTYTSGNDGILRQIGRELGLDLPGGRSGSAAPSARPSAAINLRPFLDPADGGTGAALAGGIRSTGQPEGRSLDPDAFR
ncbi:MAG: COP23 domain-containing protein [Elainellaceae cyanobacterium]